MKVLITGGYGFIGSSVAETFYAEGHNVSIMDNLTTGIEKNVKFNHRSHKMDVEDPACEKVFQSGNFDVVIHLASQKNTEDITGSSSAGSETSLLGLANILQLSRKYKVGKVVIASSASVYGKHEELPLKEEATCDPLSPSGVDNWISEQYCEKWDNHSSPNILCFRLSNVYGPKQKEGVVSRFVNEVLEGKELVVYGNGEQTRDFIYVEDVAEAIYRSVDIDLDGVYNLSANEETSINELIDCLDDVKKVKKVTYDKSKDEGIKHIKLDNSKIKQDLDWEPFYTLQEGIEKTFNWFDVYDADSEQKPLEKLKEKMESKSPVMPYLGNIGLFALMILLSSFVQDYLYMVDYQLFYIVFAAFLFGKSQTTFSIGLASIWFLYGNILNGRELVTLMIDHNTLIHIGLYMSVGLTIGYIMNKKEKLIEDARTETDAIKERHKSLDAAYQETVMVNDELKNQVLYTDTSVGTVYKVMKELDHLDPFKIYAASINIMEEVMKSNHVSFYIVDQSQETLKLVTQSAGFEAEPSLQINDDEHLMESRKANKIYVNKNMEENYPSMISPISIDGSFVGMILIYKPEFESVTLFNQNMLYVTTNLVASALKCAYQHQEAVTNGKVSVKIPVYNKEEAYA